MKTNIRVYKHPRWINFNEKYRDQGFTLMQFKTDIFACIYVNMGAKMI